MMRPIRCGTLILFSKIGADRIMMRITRNLRIGSSSGNTKWPAILIILFIIIFLQVRWRIARYRIGLPVFPGSLPAAPQKLYRTQFLSSCLQGLQEYYAILAGFVYRYYRMWK